MIRRIEQVRRHRAKSYPLSACTFAGLRHGWPRRSLPIDRGGEDSHRSFVHPKVDRPITISGSSGEDAKQYQIRAVNTAMEESMK
jgi:hypothetical protein